MDRRITRGPSPRAGAETAGFDVTRFTAAPPIAGRPPAVPILDAPESAALAAEAKADIKTRTLRLFLEQRGILPQVGLMITDKVVFNGEELVTVALGFFGNEIAYLTYARGPGVRDAAAFVVGEAAFTVRDGRVVVLPVRQSYRQVLTTWPFTMSIGSSESSVRQHCNSVCAPCFLWLASTATLSASSVVGNGASRAAAGAARAQAERYCFECVGCDWSI